MPAGWVYDNALEGMAGFLDAGLRERMLGSLTDINGGYLDLQNAAHSDIKSVLTALQSLIATTIEAGPAAMHDPSFFDGYIQQLKELEAMLTQRLNG